MNRWMKVKSEFLSSALFDRMSYSGLDIDEKSRDYVVDYKYNIIIHSFTQISEDEMIICWEGADYSGNRIMMNTKVDEYWWRDK